MPNGAYAQKALVILLEPILLLRGDPAAAVAAAEVTAHGFAKDMLRTWRRLFVNDELRFFGEPGSVIDIRLPDPAWILAKVPFRQGATDRLQRVRVVRRGVLLKKELLLPGVVVIEAGANGDVR
jgi:hypothetical protein